MAIWSALRRFLSSPCGKKNPWWMNGVCPGHEEWEWHHMCLAMLNSTEDNEKLRLSFVLFSHSLLLEFWSIFMFCFPCRLVYIDMKVKLAFCITCVLKIYCSVTFQFIFILVWRVAEISKPIFLAKNSCRNSVMTLLIIIWLPVQFAYR